MRYTLIVIAVAVTVLECSDQLPDCEKDLPSVAPSLGKDLRKTLSDGVQANMKKGSKPHLCLLRNTTVTWNTLDGWD
ncbi:hypothetical protein NECAME_18730 [Necator americanus]|uniref:Uncharacterized protein n=1 Tax=Necator americanus TaxID=51031 RepID=W2SSQ3_NECAM|nr:hypothetical protein NECAME_18730 [Necator americanus]ETN72665.1 hypothetical protein NECAME_18730 [Necator americanus]